MAVQALEEYEVRVAQVSLLRALWNTMFRVDAADGTRYVLRISRPGVPDELQIESELTWMEALARETDIVVPRPVRASDGSLLSRVQIPGVPEERFVALFSWVEGRHAFRAPSRRVIALLGETLARLHDHAETFRPPPRFTERRFDRLGGFTTHSYLRGERSHPLLTPERLHLFRREADRVQAEMDRLYGRGIPPRFLHGDLHLGNVKVMGDRLAVLDFDDSVWGYPIQDIGISLYYLLPRPHYPPEFRELFREGYTRVRAWPEEWEGQVDLMIEARALDLIEVLLDLEDPRIRQHLPQLVQRTEDQVRNLAVRGAASGGRR